MTTPDHLIEAINLRRVFRNTEVVAGISFSTRCGQDSRKATCALPPASIAHLHLGAEKPARQQMTLFDRAPRKESVSPYEFDR
jgi:hypothetical protein